MKEREELGDAPVDRKIENFHLVVNKAFFKKI